jgi:hypothetical protein
MEKRPQHHGFDPSWKVRRGILFYEKMAMKFWKRIALAAVDEPIIPARS